LDLLKEEDWTYLKKAEEKLNLEKILKSTNLPFLPLEDGPHLGITTSTTSSDPKSAAQVIVKVLNKVKFSFLTTFLITT
jgi:hypothetical protein